MTTLTATKPANAESFVVHAIYALRASGSPLFHRLKRGTEPLDAMLEPVFHEVKAQLKARRMFWLSDDQIACALMLVARLAEHPGSVPLAKKLAALGKSNKAPYSELRFANLVRSEEPAELFQNLQRALRFCEDKVEPFDLVRTVFGWRDAELHATRKHLISQFYAFA